MSAPVFVTTPQVAESAQNGDLVILDGPEGRHAGVVQRRAPGEAIDLVDGHGVRLHGVIETVAGSSVAVRITEVIREPAPSVALVLVQALAKGDRDERAVEAATELGVDRVIPWQADRSIVVWRGDRATKGRTKWLAVVRAAMKQSRRSWEPTVEAVLDTPALTARTREVIGSGGLVLILHESARQGLSMVNVPTGARLGVGTPAEILVVVGPEGGISESEVGALVQAGAVAVHLGLHILRSSTAGPAALAVLSARLNRWS